MNQIKVTNSTITFKNQTIKVANISSIDLRESIKKNNRILVFFGLLLLVGGVFQLNDSIVVSIGAFGLSGLLFWFNGIEKKNSQTYFLVIWTNSGSRQLFHNPDYAFMTDIKLKIQEVMDTHAPLTEVTINLDNKTIINNPTGNISIVNVKNYKELSSEQLEYLKNYFEPALIKIQEEIAKTNNEEIHRNFEIMKQELKSSRPRKSILEATWAMFNNLGNFSEIATTIEKGINMF